MKTIVAFVILSFVGPFHLQNINAQDKKSRQEKKLEAFKETLELVKTDHFIFVPDRAFPQGGRSIDLTTNYGFIKILNENSEGDMPFFGRGFNVAYGGDGGINFNGEIINKKMEINEQKKSIQYSFEVKDKDHFRIHMEITYGGGASVNVTSNNRSFISYNGKISKIEEKEDNKQ